MVVTGAFATGVSDAQDFTAWSIEAMRRVRSRDDAIVLFDSTIAEPTPLLSSLLQGGLQGPLGEAFVSVFGSGNPRLISALSRRYGLPEQSFLTTSGAITALDLLLHALVKPGDRVLVERPCFDLLPILAARAGAEVGFVERRFPDFALDLDQLQDGLSRGARLLLLTNLHNPSGQLLSDEQLGAIATLAERFGALVIVDEVYRGFADPAACAAARAPNMLSVNSLTKLYGLFSLKCGWIAGAPDLIDRVRTHHLHRDLGVSKLTHAVAAMVLADSAPFDTHWRTMLLRTRPVLERHVAALRADGLVEGEVPAHGCIYFPRILLPLSADHLAERLWSQEAVMAVPGTLFGLDGHLRLGFGADPVRLDLGLRRLRAALTAWAAKSRPTSAGA